MNDALTAVLQEARSRRQFDRAGCDQRQWPYRRTPETGLSQALTAVTGRHIPGSGGTPRGFWREVLCPASLLGPVLRRALARFAAICRGVAIVSVRQFCVGNCGATVVTHQLEIAEPEAATALTMAQIGFK